MIVDNFIHRFPTGPIKRVGKNIEIQVSERVVHCLMLTVALVAGLFMSLDMQGALKLPTWAYWTLNAVFSFSLWVPLQHRGKV